MKNLIVKTVHATQTNRQAKKLHELSQVVITLVADSALKDELAEAAKTLGVQVTDSAGEVIEDPTKAEIRDAILERFVEE